MTCACFKESGILPFPQIMLYRVCNISLPVGGNSDSTLYDIPSGPGEDFPLLEASAHSISVKEICEFIKEMSVLLCFFIGFSKVSCTTEFLRFIVA